MIHLSQQDPRWANITLGNSRFTVAKYGCVTTSISMLSDYFKCFQDPGEIAQKYVKYTLDGLIRWETLSLVHMNFQMRLPTRDDQAILQSIKDPRQAVILNVNNGSHWVVAIKKALFSNDYWCVDSWDGKVKLAAKTYRNIVKSVHFSIK